ncbi:MAG: aminotransferase class V-fold PLP-dependent enzyme [Flavobacteriaceae bacterium]|nr:aminotransferase class V-fold PLP-dependent enzyme [Flavobacteriaceae bacterium]
MKKSLTVFNEIVEKLLKDEANHPVAEFIASGALFDRLDLELGEEPISDEMLRESLEDLVMTTPRTATNAFFNQLFGGRNDKAVLGDLLSVLLNNSMYTYKAAGPQVGVEKIVLRKVCDLIGWDENSDGTFASGGSMTNLMSMLMARDAKDNDARYHGLSNKLTVYTSEESHYSVPKNAAFSGIGRNQVRYIQVYKFGKMDPEVLEYAIQEDMTAGNIPTLVNATAGTTVLGAFDDIEAISAICQRYDIWLHVDGAYCGSVIFSNRYRHLIRGVEKVDSFSLNAHKMMGTPLTCSLLMVKDKQYLYDSFSNDADYLYQTDHDEFNLGKTSLQCGRRNDALKFWTLWKSVGTKGLEAMVDKQFELAEVARDYVKTHSNYTLHSYDDSISVCFNYKDLPARELCTLLYEHSKLLVGYGSFGKEEFIRLVTINVQNDKEDILNFFQVIEEFVAENKSLFLKPSSVS